MKFEEKFYKKKSGYAGKAVNFNVDEITLPDGKRATREYVDHPGAVAVLPFVDKDRIILVRQYRYPVKERTYEIPAGKLDKGESILSCVKREMQEETGYKPHNIKKLLSYWPTPAFSNEIIHIFTASGLTRSALTPDEDEFIEAVVLPFEKTLAMIKSGTIKDSKTVIALLAWKNR
jgi:ADP-ribose pyrophosphatase